MTTFAQVDHHGRTANRLYRENVMRNIERVSVVSGHIRTQNHTGVRELPFPIAVERGYQAHGIVNAAKQSFQPSRFDEHIVIQQYEKVVLTISDQSVHLMRVVEIWTSIVV